MSPTPDRPDAEHPEQDPLHGSPYSAESTPAPLTVAAGTTLVEGVLTLFYGVGELFHLAQGRLTMGLTTSLFFAAYGAGLMLCAWGLYRVRTWARGPVLLAQLLWLGLAWNFRDGSTLGLAVVLVVAAVVVLAGLLHPRSIEALENAP